MGALLAARLAKEVKKILDQKCSTRAFFWTDSQVTLHWIKGPSHRWKPFVANREVSHAENWLIHSLHEREFYEEMRKLLAGTLVLIKDENLPSTKWSTGRITEIFPGTDGKVRVVNLQVSLKGEKAKLGKLVNYRVTSGMDSYRTNVELQPGAEPIDNSWPKVAFISSCVNANGLVLEPCADIKVMTQYRSA
ncbi:hypothetical protein TNCV_2515461 [Trichonephila clavipes]|nr:hypothetical protein TNCV_2515461 [Trichonephila clavipes]